MNDSSKKEFIERFVSKFKEIAKSNGYICDLEEDCFKLKKEELEFSVTLPIADLNEELDNIDYVSDLAIGSSEFADILLQCDEKTVILENQDIKIEGYVKATLNRSKDKIALLCASFDKISNFSLLKDKDEVEIHELVKDDFVICEINDMSNLSKINNKEEFDNVVNDLSYAVIALTSYRLGIKLSRYIVKPDKNYINELSTTGNALIMKKIDDIVPIQYFIAAENSDLMNLKYLEYYHVLEYFFLDEQLNKINEVVGKLLSLKIIGRDIDKSIEREIGRELLAYFSNKEENDEKKQLTTVIDKKISASGIVEILNSLNMELDFLQSGVFSKQEGLIADFNKIHDKKSKTIKDTITADEKNALKNNLCKRIYCIRNYIVHTKRGEKDLVFIPIDEHQNKLENDVKIIREIAFRLLFC